MQQQMTIEDLYPATWCGRTYPEPSAVTTEKTSEPSLKKRQKSPSRMPMFLDLRESGGTAELSWETGIPLVGASTIASIGESRRDADGFVWFVTSMGTQRQPLFLTLNCSEKPREEIPSKLSEILQSDPNPKYNLSEKACQGILNRANRRGKELPKELKEALEAQATPSKSGGGVERDPYGKKAGKGPLIQEEKSATLGVSQDQTLFAFGISPYESKGMLSDNPRVGFYETETTRTLDNNGGSPACHQGGVAIVQKGNERSKW